MPTKRSELLARSVAKRALQEFEGLLVTRETLTVGVNEEGEERRMLPASKGFLEARDMIASRFFEECASKVLGISEGVKASKGRTTSLAVRMARATAVAYMRAIGHPLVECDEEPEDQDEPGTGGESELAKKFAEALAEASKQEVWVGNDSGDREALANAREQVLATLSAGAAAEVNKGLLGRLSLTERAMEVARITQKEFLNQARSALHEEYLFMRSEEESIVDDDVGNMIGVSGEDEPSGLSFSRRGGIVCPGGEKLDRHAFESYLAGGTCAFPGEESGVLVTRFPGSGLPLLFMYPMRKHRFMTADYAWGNIHEYGVGLKGRARSRHSSCYSLDEIEKNGYLVTNLALDRRTSQDARSRLKRAPHREGCSVRYPHRLLVDRKPFDRVVEKRECTIFCDLSGSQDAAWESIKEVARRMGFANIVAGANMKVILLARNGASFDLSSIYANEGNSCGDHEQFEYARRIGMPRPWIHISDFGFVKPCQRTFAHEVRRNRVTCICNPFYTTDVESYINAISIALRLSRR